MSGVWIKTWSTLEAAFNFIWTWRYSTCVCSLKLNVKVTVFIVFAEVDLFNYCMFICKLIKPDCTIKISNTQNICFMFKCTINLVFFLVKKKLLVYMWVIYTAEVNTVHYMCTLNPQLFRCKTWDKKCESLWIRIFAKCANHHIFNSLHQCSVLCSLVIKVEI